MSLERAGEVTGDTAGGAPGDTDGDVVALARELIRVPSPNPPGDERAVAERATELAVAAGLPSPKVLSRSAERPNLLFDVGFGAGGRHLVFCGHLDTKPIGDATWAADPLGAEIDGDRLYGLGSADMKGALAAMIVAVARLVRDGVPRAGRVSLLFTADEEDGAHYGAQFLAETLDLRADAVLIGEPGGLDDDYDQLHLGSRGIARLRATAYARQGHSSLSGRPGTRNAGVDAARAAVALADRLAPREPADPHGLVGWNATVNTGLAFRGGVGYGVLPDRMGVDTEVRLLPGMGREDVREPAAELLAELARATGADLRLEFDEQGFLPGTVADPAGALPSAVRRAAERVLGRVPPDAMFPGTTDASWLQPAWNVPVLPAFGPGLLRRCHGADEWVSVTALRQAVELYADIAETFCAGPGEESP
ncbi:M20 family metallopeptidase [Actinomadura sp. HBU206391]|uniref:M20 family metallopeptidase n=1 Tax=Actinomadura sp. HBU206391 TaxID=2731692 RepID=UPI0016509D0A|nr:M20/M25/M40 family metallo-hydrolase [Actinomadura sp. HBU206391]MBC6460615.1 M20/M25/M40 family metallo-hydrolase [Actinomadura sp. HBU206391]